MLKITEKWENGRATISEYPDTESGFNNLESRVNYLDDLNFFMKVPMVKYSVNYNAKG